MMAALTVKAADKDSVKKWEGMMIHHCQQFTLEELTSKDGDLYKKLGSKYIHPETKVIYISRQAYLQKVPDTVNGYTLKYIDLDSNVKWLGKEIKNNHAAVFYLSNFELNSTLSRIYVFPIEVKKNKKQYADPAAIMNFFFNYEPTKYVYKGVELVGLD